MSLYPTNIKRCQHIKVNGTQCGSPALRDSTFCYYHIRYHWSEMEAIPNNHEWRDPFPTLEDANSIQAALANVMQRLITQEIDHKTASLLLYALQIASMNLKRTSLEPALPTQVVIDRESVANRPIGATAWSKEQGREYDEIPEEESKEEEEQLVDGMTAQERRDLDRWVHGTGSDAHDPGFLDEPRPAEGILNPMKDPSAGETAFVGGQQQRE